MGEGSGEQGQGKGPSEKVDLPACADGMNNDGDGSADYPADAGCASALDDDETFASDAPLGPWNRIKAAGSETGSGGPTDFAGSSSRVGVATALGFDVTPDNPLPPATNAVRFAAGALAVGQEVFAEISLRVTGLPLDPAMTDNVVCAEAFGGDAADPQNGQDNAWRYFLPGPACVKTDLGFELGADKSLALVGETLTYTIQGKNLSGNQQTNVVVTDSFDPAAVSFLVVLLGPAPTVEGGAGTLTWPTRTLVPG